MQNQHYGTLSPLCAMLSQTMEDYKRHRQLRMTCREVYQKWEKRKVAVKIRYSREVSALINNQVHWKVLNKRSKCNLVDSKLRARPMHKRMQLIGTQKVEMIMVMTCLGWERLMMIWRKRLKIHRRLRSNLSKLDHSNNLGQELRCKTSRRNQALVVVRQG